jgi:Zn finger protein HypA/HybF involved in hydrogenase expression
MALQPDEPGKRKCLKCGKKFASRNAGNRICPKCDRLNTREFQPHTMSSTVYTDGGTSSLHPDE